MGEGNITQPTVHKKWHLQLNNLLSLFPDHRSLEALRLFHFELPLPIFVQAHNVSTNTLLLKSLWASYKSYQTVLCQIKYTSTIFLKTGLFLPQLRVKILWDNTLRILRNSFFSSKTYEAHTYIFLKSFLKGSYNHTLKMIFTFSQFLTLRAFCP